MRSPLLVSIALVIASRVLLMLAQPFASEDAYITFRYAHHLASGLGLTYNAGQRVMGFTSLPWTLWCALGYLVHAGPVLWTQLSSACADVATAVLAIRVLDRSFGRAPAWIFGVFFGLWPLFAASAVSGLECSAMLFGIVGC